MGILKKIKSAVSGTGSDAAVEEKKPRARTKKTDKPAPVVAVSEAAHEHAHEHTHDHEHDAAPEATAPARQQQVEGLAIGVGATRFTLMPMITEKGTHAAAHNTYLFKAAPHASKGAIKQAVEKMYKVNVTAVRTSRYDGKIVRVGRIEGQRSHFKKVYVTVAKGQSITIHKGV